MRYIGVIKEDTVNAFQGSHFTIYFSGCTHHCEGCFNQVAWDFNVGDIFNQRTMIQCIELAKKEYIKGISVLGGEPFQQDKILFYIKTMKEQVKKPIFVWSGYTFEQLIEMHDAKECLNYVDVLIDGKFDITKKDPSLILRGSSNQRIIDVQESLKKGEVVLCNKILNQKS